MKKIDLYTGKVIIEIDKKYFRTVQVDLLLVNRAKIKKY